MKNTPLLITIVLLMLTQICWADGNSQVNNFSDYINSPENSADNSAKKNMNLPPMISPKTGEASDKTNSSNSDSKSITRGIPIKWKACTIDSDCTAVVADCVSWDALNKKYLNKLARNLKSCSESIDPGFQPLTTCVNQMCKTTDQTTLVSWDEWLNDMHKRREKSTPIIP